MPRIDERLRRLERLAELKAFDPPAVCRLAAECYEQGVDLPANLSDRERNLALVYIDALEQTDPSRWWSNDPLPLPPLARAP